MSSVLIGCILVLVGYFIALFIVLVVLYGTCCGQDGWMIGRFVASIAENQCSIQCNF